MDCTRNECSHIIHKFWNTSGIQYQTKFFMSSFRRRCVGPTVYPSPCLLPTHAQMRVASPYCTVQHRLRTYCAELLSVTFESFRHMHVTVSSSSNVRIDTSTRTPQQQSPLPTLSSSQSWVVWHSLCMRVCVPDTPKVTTVQNIVVNLLAYLSSTHWSLELIFLKKESNYDFKSCGTNSGCGIIVIMSYY